MLGLRTGPTPGAGSAFLYGSNMLEPAEAASFTDTLAEEDRGRAVHELRSCSEGVRKGGPPSLPYVPFYFLLGCLISEEVRPQELNKSPE